MKSFVVVHFHNGVIVEYKRKPKDEIPQPHSMKVAENAVKRLNALLGEISPQDHWAYITIAQFASIKAKEWASHTPTGGN